LIVLDVIIARLGDSSGWWVGDGYQFYWTVSGLSHIWMNLIFQVWDKDIVRATLLS
jgi:hypothetical protein